MQEEDCSGRTDEDEFSNNNQFHPRHHSACWYLAWPSIPPQTNILTLGGGTPAQSVVWLASSFEFFFLPVGRRAFLDFLFWPFRLPAAISSVRCPVCLQTECEFKYLYQNGERIHKDIKIQKSLVSILVDRYSNRFMEQQLLFLESVFKRNSLWHNMVLVNDSYSRSFRSTHAGKQCEVCEALFQAVPNLTAE